MRYGLRRSNYILWAPRLVASFRSAYRDDQFQFVELTPIECVGDGLPDVPPEKLTSMCKFSANSGAFPANAGRVVEDADPYTLIDPIRRADHSELSSGPNSVIRLPANQNEL